MAPQQPHQENDAPKNQLRGHGAPDAHDAKAPGIQKDHQHPHAPHAAKVQKERSLAVPSAPEGTDDHDADGKQRFRKGHHPQNAAGHSHHLRVRRQSAGQQRRGEEQQSAGDAHQ